MTKASIDAKGGLQAGGRGIGSLLLSLLLVTTVAGGVGFLGGLELKRKLLPAKAPDLAVVEAKVEKSGGTQVLPLPAVVTNLAGHSGGWVRLEASVLFADSKTSPPQLAGQLAEDVTALLRTLTVLQISGASGFQHLREEILERLRTRTSGRVRDVFIQSMVIE